MDTPLIKSRGDVGWANLTIQLLPKDSADAANVGPFAEEASGVQYLIADPARPGRAIGSDEVDYSIEIGASSGAPDDLHPGNFARISATT